MFRQARRRLSSRALRRRHARQIARRGYARSRTPFLLFALAVGLGFRGYAATDTWSGTAGNGLWGTAANWNGGGGPVPNSGDTVQNLLTNSAITLNVNATVNSFLDDSAYTISGGDTLSGSQSNQASTVTVNDPFMINGGGLNNLTVSGGQGPTFTGAGNAITNVTFSSGVSFGSASVGVYRTNTINSAGTIAGGTLQLNPDNNGGTLALTGAGSLSGYGSITQNYGGTVTNTGTINANSSGNTLSVGVNSVTGDGTYEATNGGTLNLGNVSTNAGTFAASGGGDVILGSSINFGTGSAVDVADATSTVQAQNATLTGILVSTTGTGLTLDGATANTLSNLTTDAGTTLTFTAGGSIQDLDRTVTVGGAMNLNNATVRLNPGNNGGTLNLTGTLTGSGTVSQNYGGAVNNSGTIDANSSGSPLTFNLNTVNNNIGGVVEAMNGATLNIDKDTFTNAGTVQDTGASTVSFSNDTLNAQAGSRFNAGPSGTLLATNNTTVQGEVGSTTGTGLTFDGTTTDTLSNLTTDAGTVLTFTAAANGDQQQLNGTETVAGAMNLSGASLRLNPGNNGGTLDLTSTGTLTGSGFVNQNYSGTVTNAGTITANGAGPLTFSLDTFTDNAGGVAEATGSGGLTIENSNVTNAGTLHAAGSNVTLSHDTLNAASGSFQVDPGRTLLVTNNTTVQGEVGSTTGTGLTFDGTTTDTLSNLTTDAGTVLTFTAAANGDQQQLNGTETVAGAMNLSGASLRLNPGNNGGTLHLTGAGTLTGTGLVNQNYGGTVINDGAITASGGTLSFTEDNFNNDGTTSAVAGASLTLGGARVNANGTGTIDATGGNVTIQNGTLTAQAGSQFQTASGGTITVNNETVTGEIGQLTALNLTNSNTLTNLTVDDGTLNFGTSADDVNGTVTVDGAMNLAGASLRLNPGNGGGTLNLTSTGTLTGYGTVYQNYSGTFNNNGVVNANNSANPLTFSLDHFNNNAGSVAEATGGATLNINKDTFTNVGTVSDTGASTVIFSNDTLNAQAGSQFNAGPSGTLLVTNNTTVQGEVGSTTGTGLTFDGTTGNAMSGLTTDAGTVLTFTAATGGHTQNVYGTDTFNGAETLNGAALYLNPGNSGASLTVGSAGTLTGSGSVTQNYGSTVTDNGTINATGGTLTFGVSTFVNNATAGATTGSGLVFNGGQLTNNATIQSNGGGVTIENGTMTGGGAASVLDATSGTITATNETLNGEIGAATGSGLMLSSAGGNNALVGLTFDSGTLAVGSSTATVYGTNTLNGAASISGGDLYLNPGNGGANLVVNGSLSGTGTVNQNYGATVSDNGTINANSATGPLTVAVSSFNVNAGAVAEATGAGGLVFNGAGIGGSTVTDTATGTIAANGGSVTIENGTLNSVAGSTYAATGGTITATNETLTGEIGSATGSGLTLSSAGGNNALVGLTFDSGTLAVGSSTATVYGTNTLNGAASISGGDLYLNPGNGGANLVVNGSLSGTGTVNQNYGAAVNDNGTIDASGGTLNVNTNTLNNTGILQAENGATLSVTSNTTDSGSLLVKSGGTETFSQNTLTQTGAGTSQVDGTLNVTNSALSGGTLRGTGTVNSAVTNTGGTVQGGDTGGTGTLTIKSSYTQGTGGTLLEQLGGTSAGQFSVLNVMGAASLAGTLDVGLTNGFGPAVGNTFAFLDYGSLGNLSGLTVDSLTPGYTYTVSNNAALDQLDLTVTNANPNTDFFDGAASDGGLYGTAGNWDPTNAAVDPSAHTPPANGDIVENLHTGLPVTLNVNAAVQSFLDDSGFTISGGNTFSGSLANSASTITVFGTFAINGGGLSNLTVTGTSQAPAFSGTGNTMSNVILNSGASFGVATVALSGTDTLDGAATVAGGTLELNPSNGGGTLAIGSTGSLSGSGTLNQNYNGTLTNAGTVSANVSGATLNVAENSVSGAGTFEATGGGTLALSNGTLTTQAATQFLVFGTGSAITANNETVTGEIGTTTGSGLTLTGSDTISNLTADAGTTLTSINGTTAVSGTDTINGTLALAGTSLELNPSNAGGALTIGTTGTLTGSGTVVQNYGGTLTNAGTIAPGTGNSLTITGTRLVADAGSAFLAPSGSSIIAKSSTVTGEISKTTGSGLTFEGGNTLNNLTTDAGTTVTFTAGDTDFQIGTDTLNGTAVLGGGTLELNPSNGGGSLNIGATGSLVGQGAITQNYNGTLNNAGIINADVSGGTLTVTENPVGGAGVYEATGGGTLAFTNGALNPTTGSSFLVSGTGSAITLNGETVGGEIGTTTGGGLTFNGSNTLAGLTTDAGTALTFSAGSTEFQTGTDTFNGALTLAGGTVELNPSNGGGSANIGATGSLSGQGAVTQNYNGTFNNAGTVNANVSGQSLSLGVNQVGGAGTFEATNGGTLAFTGGTLTAQAGTLFKTGTGSAITFNGETVTGEIGSTTGAGLTFNGSNALNNLTADAGTALALSTGSTETVTGTDVLNGSATLAGGTLELNPSNGGGSLNVGATGSLSGRGTITQNYNGTLNNAGIINADVSGQSLSVNGVTIGGGGVYEATNGGALTFGGGTLAPTTGSSFLVSGTGSTVTVANETVSGEISTTSGAGPALTGGDTLLNLTTDAGTSLTLTNGNFANGTDAINGSAVLAGATLELSPSNGGGTLDVGATGSLSGSGSVSQNYAGAVNNAGTIEASVGGQTLALSANSLVNTGTLQADTNATLQDNTPTTDSGNITVQKSGTATFTPAAGLTQTAGLTQVDGTLNAASFSLQGGRLDGTGTVNSSVTNTGGTVKGGDSPGTLTITANYTQTSTGSLLEELGGTGAGFFDVLNVNGTASPLGTLDVSLINGFAPNVGNTFAFLDYGALAPPALNGQGMPLLSVVSLDQGYQYTVGNNTAGKDLFLTVTARPGGVPAVPEPSSLVLLGLGSLGLIGVARRRRRDTTA